MPTDATRSPSNQAAHNFPHPLLALLHENAESCVKCQLCVKECAFLQNHGTPKDIADSALSNPGMSLGFSFECSLCGLCKAVCPPKIGLDPAAMFLAMRREANRRGEGEFARHKIIKNYEQRGTSKRYTYYGLPEGCTTVLFPGCALPGTRPARVKALFQHIRQRDPTLGIVLDCCTKPSHDLGREDFFSAMFGEMQDYLVDAGVREVLTACPNCHRVFKQYGGPLRAVTVYQFMAEQGMPDTGQTSGLITVHDPCGTRFEPSVQLAVRQLAQKKSLKITEMKHHGSKTLCCGEGGSVSCLQPKLAGKWGEKRKGESGEWPILTYCAGCANFLNRLTPTSHILDLLFEPEKTMRGRVRAAKAPFTYLNRILLKRWFKKHVAARVHRERTFAG